MLGGGLDIMRHLLYITRTSDMFSVLTNAHVLYYYSFIFMALYFITIRYIVACSFSSHFFIHEVLV